MVYELPHIMVPGTPATDRFRRRGGGGGDDEAYEIRNRQAHAGALREDLRQPDSVVLRLHLSSPRIDDLLLGKAEDKVCGPVAA